MLHKQYIHCHKWMFAQSRNEAVQTLKNVLNQLYPDQAVRRGRVVATSPASTSADASPGPTDAAPSPPASDVSPPAGDAAGHVGDKVVVSEAASCGHVSSSASPADTMATIPLEAAESDWPPCPLVPKNSLDRWKPRKNKAPCAFMHVTPLPFANWPGRCGACKDGRGACGLEMGFVFCVFGLFDGFVNT